MAIESLIAETCSNQCTELFFQSVFVAFQAAGKFFMLLRVVDLWALGSVFYAGILWLWSRNVHWCLFIHHHSNPQSPSIQVSLWDVALSVVISRQSLPLLPLPSFMQVLSSVWLGAVVWPLFSRGAFENKIQLLYVKDCEFVFLGRAGQGRLAWEESNTT